MKAFPGPLMWFLFWKACGPTSQFTLKKTMTQLQKVNSTTLVWMSKLGDQLTWTRHKFNPDIKSDVNKTNFVESFNATLGVDRLRHVLTLFEGVRRVTMVRLASRRIQVVQGESRTSNALFSGQGEFEVLDGKSVLPVSLKNRTFACNLWKMSGITCKHGMRAIFHANEDPLKYVSNWYNVDVYKRAYSSNNKANPDQEQWSEMDMPEITPLVMKRGIGRPSRNRRREEDEQ
ncbi:DNA repair and recombination protein RDH54 [Bienertia sinuspersici]